MYDTFTQRLRRAGARINRHRFHLGPETLADRIFPTSLAMDVVLTLAGTTLVAVGAQFVVPLWPVPSTGQSVGVLFMGFLLGPLRGLTAMVLYLALGAAGLPIFNSGGGGLDHLLGETGGYLFGFILAVLIAGFFTTRGWIERFPLAFLASSLGSFSIFITGIPWLMVRHGYSIIDALTFGLLPLITAAIVKSLFLAVVVHALWRANERRLDAEAQSNAARTAGIRA